MKKKVKRKYRRDDEQIAPSAPSNEVLTRNEKLTRFMLEEFKSTKYVVLAETIEPGNGAVMYMSCDNNVNRCPSDYIGMASSLIANVMRQQIFGPKD